MQREGDSILLRTAFALLPGMNSMIPATYASTTTHRQSVKLADSVQKHPENGAYWILEVFSPEAIIEAIVDVVLESLF